MIVELSRLMMHNSMSKLWTCSITYMCNSSDVPQRDCYCCSQRRNLSEMILHCICDNLQFWMHPTHVLLLSLHDRALPCTVATWCMAELYHKQTAATAWMA